MSSLNPSNEFLKLRVVWGQPPLLTFAGCVRSKGSFVGGISMYFIVWLTLYTNLNNHI